MATTVEFTFLKDANGNFYYPPLGENDITSHVMSVSVDRGKQNFLTPFSAGQASVVLQNNDRMFDPSLDSPSPYKGEIVPGGELRIKTFGVVVFLGIINDWNFAYSVDGTSTATIVASDAFSLFNNKTFAADTSYNDELSSVRMSNVLDSISWPSSKRIISTGRSVLDGYGVKEGDDVLSYMQVIEKSEPGRLFMDKNGNICFRSSNDNNYEPIYTYRRTNLSGNPSFEVDLSNWSSTGGFARSTAASYVGSASATLAAFGGAYQKFNMVANVPYTVSVYVRTQPSVTSALVYLNLYTGSDGSSFGLRGGTSMTVTNATDPDTGLPGWNRMSYTFTNTWNDIYGQIGITALAGVYIDAILIEASPTLGSYFDGSTPPPTDGMSTYVTGWNL